MPDRGLFDVSTLPAPAIAPGSPAPWVLEGARWAQITFEVGQQAALSAIPGDATRPIPTYARLFMVDAPRSPAGPFRLAALLVGARYQMLPRNVLVDAIVDGPVDEVAATFGGPLRPGSVGIERNGARLIAAVGDEDGPLATVVLPELYAIDPGMLRWDAWLGFADQDGRTAMVEYGPQHREAAAWLSKGATVDMAGRLPRIHRWRTFRNLLTVSACYLEGTLELSAPALQPLA